MPETQTATEEYNDVLRQAILAFGKLGARETFELGTLFNIGYALGYKHGGQNA